MNLQIVFFTTPNVEGRKILSYQGIVHASQVAEMEFSNAAYGLYGSSKSCYKETMDKLCNDVYRNLESLALSRGANAVIGVHVDYHRGKDDKGYNMLAAFAQGTAVTIDKPAYEIHEQVIDIIDNRIFEREVFINSIPDKLNSNRGLSSEDWEKIILYADVSIAEMLHNKYIERSKRRSSVGSWDDWSRYYDRYFSLLPYDAQVKLAYLDTTDASYYTWMIKENNLFEPQKILAAAQNGNVAFAIYCLGAKKRSYTKDDLQDMETLYDYLSQMSDDAKKIKDLGRYEVDERIEELKREISVLKKLLNTIA